MRYLLIASMLVLAGCNTNPCASKQSRHLFSDNGYIYSDNSAYLLIPEDDLRALFNDKRAAELFVDNRKILNRLIQLQLTLDE